MYDEEVRVLGDRVAVTSGIGGIGTWTLSEAVHFANDLIPLLTVAMMSLTCLWYLWRMFDRVRFGPAQKRGSDDG
jgi:hypothetical protein